VIPGRTNPSYPLPLPIEGRCSEEGWCWQNPLPSGNPFAVAWAVGRDDAWFGGDDGSVVHFDGSTWIQYSVGKRVLGIWGSSSDDVWVVSRDQVHHWQGASMEAVSVPGSEFAEVTGSGRNDVWIRTPLVNAVSHYDGNGWAQVALTIPLAAMVSIGQGTIMGFGYDGTTWTISAAGANSSPGPAFRVPNAITPSHRMHAWARASDDIFMLAEVDGGAFVGEVWHFDGGGWKVVTPAKPILAAPEIFAVGGSVGGEALAIGTDRCHRWNGSAWDECAVAWSAPLQYQKRLREPPLSISTGIGDTWVLSADLVRAGSTGWEHPRSGENIAAVRAVAPDDVWAVTSRGAAWHHDGVHWFKTDTGSSGSLLDVLPLAPDDVWAVGDERIAHFDGTKWSNISQPGRHWRSIARAGSTLWIVGQEDVGDPVVLLRLDNGTWTSYQGPPKQVDMPRLRADHRGRLLMAGYSALYRLETTDDWNLISTKAGSGHIVDVAWLSDTEAYLVYEHHLGHSSEVFHWDGKTWRPVFAARDFSLLGIAGSTSDAVWAVGTDGKIVRATAGGVFVEATGCTQHLNAVSVEGRDVWAVGDAGTILHRRLPE
jgi:hypothetical protein